MMTRGGCHAFGDEITSPSEMHIRALDLLLSRLDGRHISRIVAVTGSAQQHAAVYLSSSTLSKLSSLQNTPNAQLLQHLAPFTTLPNSPNGQDTSTASQARELGRIFGGERGEELVWRTGGRVHHRYTGLQIMKLRQTKPQILADTAQILLLSTWITSLFLGRLAPTDESDACATGLWNVRERRWDEKIAGVVLGDFKKDGVSGAALIERWLGGVKRFNGESAGTIGRYFVQRFNFSPDCKVFAFTGDVPSTALSFTLSPTDAIISLGVGDADTVMLPIDKFQPSAAHQVFPHPAEREDGKWIAAIPYKDASMARSFVRDIYCNHSWDVFNTFVNQIAPGGSIGLDDKLFSFFYPHGESGVWQGISRFERGQRVTDYGDRRANPRAILESQFLSMRIRLSALFEPKSKKPKKDNNDHSALPQRIIVVGPASENATLLQTLSNVLGAPVFKAMSCAGFNADPSTPTSAKRKIDNTTSIGAEGDGTEAGDEEEERSASAFGAAYKARWAYEGTRESFEAFTARQLRSKSTPSNGPAFLEPQPLSRIPSSQNTSLTIPSTVTPPTAAATAAAASGAGSNLIVPILTDDKDAELGLRKVAEPDEDAFKFYGAMIEEFLRLEGFVQKGLL
ncbi:actin-like ATPase domain-containing protein [Atractiella rhizophila]|nr:actin-like ATPase domain-containing protein [Atractiella rhizophila]